MPGELVLLRLTGGQTRRAPAAPEAHHQTWSLEVDSGGAGCQQAAQDGLRVKYGLGPPCSVGQGLRVCDCPRVRRICAEADGALSALGVRAVADELSLRVPQGLSLVGYDNTSLARIRHLWLTSVDNASAAVGSQAAEALVHRMAAPDAAATTRLLPPRLVVRNSTAPPADEQRRPVTAVSQCPCVQLLTPPALGGGARLRPCLALLGLAFVVLVAAGSA
jgi:Periplasmic binding protein-like domain